MRCCIAFLLVMGSLWLQAQDPVQQKLQEREARIRQSLVQRADRIQKSDSARRQRIWQRIGLLQMPGAPSYRTGDQPLERPTAAPFPPFRAESIEKKAADHDLLPFLQELGPQPLSVEGRRMQLRFFGRKLDFAIDPTMSLELRDTQDATLRQAWDQLAACDYPSLLAQLQEVRAALLLNDWGYVQLANQLTKACLPAAASAFAHRVFTAFLLEYSGYEVGLARKQGDAGLHLVIASADTMYRLAYLDPGQLPKGRSASCFYYVIEPENGKMPTRFTGDESWAYWAPKDQKRGKELDMTILYAPLLDEENWQGSEPDFVQKDFTFDYAGEPRQLSWRLSRNLLAFYDSYPVTALKHIFFVSLGQSTLYFKTPHHPNWLLAQCQDEWEQISMLLAFCQSLPRLEDQGDMEEYYFPEQTLMKGLSDCDDRSVLFAALMRCYIGYEVQMLLWEAPKVKNPHVATRVQMGQGRWVYCDPISQEAVSGGGLPPGELPYPYCEAKPRCLSHSVNSCGR